MTLSELITELENKKSDDIYNIRCCYCSNGLQHCGTKYEIDDEKNTLLCETCIANGKKPTFQILLSKNKDKIISYEYLPKAAAPQVKPIIAEPKKQTVETKSKK